MTDQTTDVMMTETVERIATKRPTTEFYVYFGIIFLATLPLASLTWALAAIKSRSLTDKGPVARAWSQARIITPMIFSAP
ncbi:cytochrome PufQ [Palleronia sp. KMU-117]|uniref:cytochrome PufQ n=1 Tax=Palleronia sp. KMU-117 TaxID=3434108 RepID=UPI003D75B2AA